VSDLSSETPATLEPMGQRRVESEQGGFARNCILARRLLERGVRFVELFNGSTRWAKGSATGTAIARSKSNTTFTLRFSINRPPPCSKI